MSTFVNPSEEEAPLLPALAIIDCHHHIFAHAASTSRPARRYLLEDLLADIDGSGHNVVATVFVQDYSLYKQDGPVELRSVGETEAANGVAAMSASGAFGPCRVHAGIVAYADLELGERARSVLQAHLAAAGGRLRSIRCSVAYEAYPIFGAPMDPARIGVMGRPNFRAGVAQLAPLGLSLDIFCFHTQIGEVADLASALPDTTIVLNHLATPLGVGPYAGRSAEVMAQWKAGMMDLARRANVVVKVGGLGMPMLGLPSAGRQPRSGSAVLAEEWRPYVETCIELFGVDRCMFESNYPADRPTAPYGVLWNAFKRLTMGCSDDERVALFSGVANRVYRLSIGG